MTVQAQRRALARSARRADRGRRLRVARAALRARGFSPHESGLLVLAAGRQCPCGACGGRGDVPFAARFLPGWASLPAEVRAVHDAHAARVFALAWLRVAGPERAAAAWLRLVLATVRLRAAVRVLVAVGLRVRRSAALAIRLPAVELATSLDLSPPLVRAIFAGGAAMPP